MTPAQVRQTFSNAFLLVWFDQDWWANYVPDPETSGNASVGDFAMLAGVKLDDVQPTKGKFNGALGMWELD